MYNTTNHQIAMPKRPLVDLFATVPNAMGILYSAPDRELYYTGVVCLTRAPTSTLDALMVGREADRRISLNRGSIPASLTGGCRHTSSRMPVYLLVSAPTNMDTTDNICTNNRHFCTFPEWYAIDRPEAYILCYRMSSSPHALLVLRSCYTTDKRNCRVRP
jgi:hypothetical protein